MIPPALDQLRRIFSGKSAIDGLVRIGQMGASLGEVKGDWLYLWVRQRQAPHSALGSSAMRFMNSKLQAILGLRNVLSDDGTVTDKSGYVLGNIYNEI